MASNGKRPEKMNGENSLSESRAQDVLQTTMGQMRHWKLRNRRRCGKCDMDSIGKVAKSGAGEKNADSGPHITEKDREERHKDWKHNQDDSDPKRKQGWKKAQPADGGIQ